MKLGLAAIAAVATFALAAGFARADVFQTYDLAWSGDGASATGTITLDLTTLIDPTINGGGLGGSDAYEIYSDITALDITVTGAGSGNGTYTRADLCQCSDLGSYTYWDTQGDTIDMHGNVLAQLITDGGDFNLFFTSPGPKGFLPLTMETGGGSDDFITMTEFVAVPEPAAWIMLGLGVFGLGFALRRARGAVTAG